MRNSARRWLYWSPRVLCIAFALFTSIFAFDVFDEAHGFWQTAVALTMHLLPTMILLVGLAIAWRWEWVGTVLYAGLGVLYLAWAWGRFPWSVYIIMTGPLFLLAALFLVNWLRHDELRASPSPAALAEHPR